MTSEPAISPLVSHWPLDGLRLSLQAPAGSLELRPPDDADLAALADLAAAGVHEPDVQPFAIAWTDVEPAARARSVLQYHWSQLASWHPSNWHLDLAVVLDGVVVGTQGTGARDFAVLREVSTGSWLGRDYHKRGIGTAMRTAVLALAFDGLGAHYAASDAFTENAASLGVSRKLGYADDGIRRLVVRDRPVTSQRLRLDRESWLAHPTAQVEISGLEPCLPMFGLGTD
jgi:RimJ/RimL family protein N-acetyltransferase